MSDYDREHLDPSPRLSRRDREYMRNRLTEARNELEDLLIEVDELKEEIEYIENLLD